MDEFAGSQNGLIQAGRAQVRANDSSSGGQGATKEIDKDDVAFFADEYFGTTATPHECVDRIFQHVRKQNLLVGISALDAANSHAPTKGLILEPNGNGCNRTDVKETIGESVFVSSDETR